MVSNDKTKKKKNCNIKKKSSTILIKQILIVTVGMPLPKNLVNPYFTRKAEIKEFWLIASIRTYDCLKFTKGPIYLSY